jgi:hypothetical protein
MKRDPCTPLLIDLAKDSIRIPFALRAFAQVERKGAVWLREIPGEVLTSEIKQQQEDEWRHADLLDQLAHELAGGDISLHPQRPFTETYLGGIRRGLDRICIRKRKSGAAEVNLGALYLARYSLLGILFERRAYRIYSVIATHSKNPELKKLMKQLVMEEKEHYIYAARSLGHSVQELGTSTEELFEMEGELALCWMKNLHALHS